MYRKGPPTEPTSPTTPAPAAGVPRKARLYRCRRALRKIALLVSLLMGFNYCFNDGCFETCAIAEYGSRLVFGKAPLDKGLDDLAELHAELADMYEPVVGDPLRVSHHAYIMGNHL